MWLEFNEMCFWSQVNPRSPSLLQWWVKCELYQAFWLVPHGLASIEMSDFETGSLWTVQCCSHEHNKDLWLLCGCTSKCVSINGTQPRRMARYLHHKRSVPFSILTWSDATKSVNFCLSDPRLGAISIIHPMFPSLSIGPCVLFQFNEVRIAWMDGMRWDVKGGPVVYNTGWGGCSSFGTYTHILSSWDEIGERLSDGDDDEEEELTVSNWRDEEKNIANCFHVCSCHDQFGWLFSSLFTTTAVREGEGRYK